MLPSQITHAVCTNAPLFHPKCWLLNCVLIASRMVPFLFSPASMISPQKFKFIRPQDTFPLSIHHLNAFVLSHMFF